MVRVYRNLLKKCWSVKDGRNPIRHKVSLCLKNVRFRVWEGGRQRVLREQRKSVHAFAEGDLSDNWADAWSVCHTQVTYNPYKCGAFYEVATGQLMFSTPMAMFLSDGTVMAL